VHKRNHIFNAYADLEIESGRERQGENARERERREDRITFTKYLVA